MNKSPNHMGHQNKRPTFATRHISRQSQHSGTMGILFKTISAVRSDQRLKGPRPLRSFGIHVTPTPFSPSSLSSPFCNVAGVPPNAVVAALSIKLRRNPRTSNLSNLSGFEEIIPLFSCSVGSQVSFCDIIYGNSPHMPYVIHLQFCFPTGV